MEYQIRSERLEDYAAIAEIHYRAFDNKESIPMIVALHRQRPVFDPRFSLVAEQDGAIVGHVLFSPQTFRILGQSVSALVLSPVAVDPAHQKKGFGRALIEAGHTIARTTDYKFSLLLGHPTYYPHLGYIQRAYGASSVHVAVKDLPRGEILESRPPVPSDVPDLIDLWEQSEGKVSLTLEPELRILSWLSPNPAIATRAFFRAGQLCGYARYAQNNPLRSRILLARDAQAAADIAVTLAQGANSADIMELPLHPDSIGAEVFGTPQARAWDAAMVYPLAPSPLDEYLVKLQAGEIPPGRALWGIEFDFD
jgi:putative acetyltransferase